MKDDSGLSFSFLFTKKFQSWPIHNYQGEPMPNFPQIGRFFTELGIYTSVSRQLGNILGENDDFGLRFSSKHQVTLIPNLNLTLTPPKEFWFGLSSRFETFKYLHETKIRQIGGLRKISGGIMEVKNFVMK